MSGLCALVMLDGRSCDPELLARMRRSLAQRGDVTGSWSDGVTGLAMAEWSERGDGGLPFCCRSGQVVIAADARLDNRRTLGALLSDRLRGQPTDTALIAAAYDRWGERCLEHLHGDYAFVLWDACKPCLFAARDPMGLRPLVYHSNERRFLCASEARQVLEDSSVARDLHPTWLAMWLLEGVDHWSCTTFRAIQELAPGHFLRLDRHGLHIVPYWQPWPREAPGYAGQQDATEQIRSLLKEAVADRMQDERPVLCDLSGGLDSSSILCLAAGDRSHEQQAGSIHALHAFSRQYCEADDRALARPVAQQYGNIVILHELSYDAHPAFADLFEIRPWISAPAVAPICLSALYRGIGQIAHQTGARGYLRGDFGDQLFGASFSYLAHLWQEQRYETFLREVRRWQHLHGLAPLDLFYAHAVRPRLLERQKPHQQGHAPWVRPQLWHECERRLEEDEAYFRRVCPEPVVRRLFREMRGHKEFVSMQEELLATGLETREPYTDLRLVECILTYPPQDQMRPGVRKYLLREAMTGILPEPIRQRRDKGRIARIFFSGIARHQKELQELVHHAPDSITSYLDTVQLAEAVRRVALGDTADQVTLFSALALVLWVHRLPWGGGWLSAGQQRERNEKYMEKGGER